MDPGLRRDDAEFGEPPWRSWPARASFSRHI